MRPELSKAAAGAVLLLAAPLAAVDLPRPSPGASVSQKVGTARIAVEYHRPAVKGRKIWGELVPYGQAWRLGANDATTLEISHDAKVAGKDLPAGKYALFAIPTEKAWTLVVNKKWKQWGAYFRDPKEDAFTFEVTPEAAPMAEWMEFRIQPASPSEARVSLAWEKLQVSFPVSFDVNGIAWKELDAALAAAKPDAWTSHFQAAQFARNTGTRTAEAMGYLDEAMKRGQSFWMEELKGDFLADAGKFAEAAPWGEKAYENSKKGGAPDEYRTNLRKKIDGWKAKAK